MDFVQKRLGTAVSFGFALVLAVNCCVSESDAMQLFSAAGLWRRRLRDINEISGGGFFYRDLKARDFIVRGHGRGARSAGRRVNDVDARLARLRRSSRRQ